MMKKNKKLGVLSIFTAAGFYGLYGILSRLIGSSFGNFNQNWIRNIIVIVIIGTVIYFNKTKLISLKKKDIKWIILWFLSGSWVTVLTFIAFNHLQIGTTYLVIYSTMITAGFLSGKIFFSEKLNSLKIISLIFCFIGLFIIFKFSIKPRDYFYILLAMTSGFMTGVWNTISKKFSDNYPNNQLVLMDAISSVIAALIGALIFKESFLVAASPISWFWIIVFACIQTMDVGLIVYGFRNIEAQIGSIILPVEVIFAVIFSYLIFREIPSQSTFIGGSLIMVAAILPNLNLSVRKYFN